MLQRFRRRSEIEPLPDDDGDIEDVDVERAEVRPSANGGAVKDDKDDSKNVSDSDNYDDFADDNDDNDNIDLDNAAAADDDELERLGGGGTILNLNGGANPQNKIDSVPPAVDRIPQRVLRSQDAPDKDDDVEMELRSHQSANRSSRMSSTMPATLLPPSGHDRRSEASVTRSQRSNTNASYSRGNHTLSSMAREHQRQELLRIQEEKFRRTLCIVVAVIAAWCIVAAIIGGLIGSKL